MKKSLIPILVLLAGCACDKKENISCIRDIEVDFATADTIQFSLKQTFDTIFEVNNIHVKDSVIFINENNYDDAGYCYNMKNGERLSKIITKGRAANEVLVPTYRITGDSIRILENEFNKILTFSISDVISKPISERKFYTFKVPDEIQTINPSMIDHNTVFGNNFSSKHNNKNLYFICQGDKTTFFGDFKSEIFGGIKDTIKLDEIVKKYFTMPIIGQNKNKVVVGYYNSMILQIIDVDEKTVEKEVYYTSFNKSDVGKRFGSRHNISLINCDDEYIYVFISERDIKNSKIEGKDVIINHILVYDWELNPIKKYYIPYEDYIVKSMYGKVLYIMIPANEEKNLFEYHF